MNKYVAGWDGGGTKTAVEVRDVFGKQLMRQNFGPMNLNGASFKTVNKTICEIFDAFAMLPGGLESCEAICIGSAGISNQTAQQSILQSVKKTGYAKKLQLVGDHETALYGALESPVGAVLIAGTGSVCFGQSGNNQQWRTGGWGYKIDDEGSGYAIGRDIISAVVRAEDGRTSSTVLTHMVYEKLNITNINELIQFVYAPETSKQDIACLAPLLTNALEQKDLAAFGIFEKVCNELVYLAVPVITRLQLENEKLAFLGSILTKENTIRRIVENRLSEKFSALHYIKAKNDAAVGAALMAQNLLINK